MQPVTADDCRLLLSALDYAIVSPEQRARVQAWLEAKKAALEGINRSAPEMPPFRYLEREDAPHVPVPSAVRLL